MLKKRQILFRGTLRIGVGTTVIGFYSREERLHLALNTEEEFIAKDLGRSSGVHRIEN